MTERGIQALFLLMLQMSTYEDTSISLWRNMMFRQYGWVVWFANRLNNE